MVNGGSVFRDITNQSIHGDFIRNRLYNSTKGEPFVKLIKRLCFSLSHWIKLNCDECVTPPSKTKFCASLVDNIIRSSIENSNCYWMKQHTWTQRHKTTINAFSPFNSYYFVQLSVNHAKTAEWFIGMPISNTTFVQCLPLCHSIFL